MRKLHLSGLFLAWAMAGPIAAQDSAWRPEMVPTDSMAAKAPWGPGEHLVYNVKVGWFSVGYGHLTVEGLDEVRGNRTYRASLGIDGKMLGMVVRDESTTWMDVETLQSWRYVADLHEISYKALRHFEFYPERRVWEREDNDESGPLASPIPLDDIAFLYFLRTLPLNVGDSYTFDRYFKEEGNPVVVNVVRKDHRKTEAGEFDTIVVRPIIRTSGLFGEGGEAELHFTDDERRLLVYMKSDIPKFPGSLTLHLASIQEGFPVNPTSRAEALEARKQRRQGEPAGQ